MTSFLNQYKRQVKLNIDLPSSGQYYPEGTLKDGKATGLPVFGMTANDEITIKTPDALFSGSATVEVIRSCVPDILDPWNMPTIDLDFVLAAIRIATYGETISMKVTCPHCKQQHEMDYNLQGMKSKDYALDCAHLITKHKQTLVLNCLQHNVNLHKYLKNGTNKRRMMLSKNW